MIIEIDFPSGWLVKVTLSDPGTKVTDVRWACPEKATGKQIVEILHVLAGRGKVEDLHIQSIWNDLVTLLYEKTFEIRRTVKA